MQSCTTEELAREITYLVGANSESAFFEETVKGFVKWLNQKHK